MNSTCCLEGGCFKHILIYIVILSAFCFAYFLNVVKNTFFILNCKKKPLLSKALRSYGNIYTYLLPQPSDYGSTHKLKIFLDLNTFWFQQFFIGVFFYYFVPCYWLLLFIPCFIFSAAGDIFRVFNS